MKYRHWTMICLVMALCGIFLPAQQQYHLDFHFNYVQGFDTNPLLLPNVSTNWDNIYNFFTSTNFTITGQSHELNLQYGYGRQHTGGQVNQNSNLHSFVGNYIWTISNRKRLNISNYTSYSPDFTPNQVYEGGVIIPGQQPGSPDIFLTRTSRITNQANIQLSWDQSARSEWRFGYTNDLTHYSSSLDSAPASNTMSHFASVDFQHHLSNRFALGVDYSFQYIYYDLYSNVNSHIIMPSIWWLIRPSLTLEAAAGPIRASVPDQNRSYNFLNCRSRLTKTFRSGTLNLLYTRTLSSTYGVLGGSRSDTAWITWEVDLARSLRWETGGAYGKDALLDGDQRVTRYVASTSLRYILNRHIEFFAVYRWTKQDFTPQADYNMKRNQIFVGISFALPNAWRGRS